MALTDPNPAGFARDPARGPKTFRDSKAILPDLTRLAALRGEAQENLRLLQLLDRAPQAFLALMLLGGLVLLEASLQGGAALGAAFAWSLWVLTGILAMTV